MSGLEVTRLPVSASRGKRSRYGGNCSARPAPSRCSSATRCCVSLRGALFGLLKGNASAFPIKQLYHDRHHPSAWGHSLMAQMVTRLLEDAIAQRSRQQQQQQQQRHLPSSSCVATAHEWQAAHEGATGNDASPARLWEPLFSKEDAAPVGTCLKDRELAAAVEPGSAVGFSYMVEGRDAGERQTQADAPGRKCR